MVAELIEQAVRSGPQLAMLGPFEVHIDGGPPLPMGGLRERALLAVLALHANEVVSKDRLIDELWGEHPPDRPAHAVDVFVSRLRRALGESRDRLVTRAPGYVLKLGFEELDSARCKRLYDAGRAALAAGDAPSAVAHLDEALSLWRGDPLDDFTYEPFAQATIAQLQELRISCREERIEADLALGRHAEVVSELEAVVREHPFRERPHAQLMLALYRCGRQADALDEFQRARRMLVEQLAVGQPSATLRELERAILRQDTSLDPPGGRGGERHRPGRSRSASSETQIEPGRADAQFEAMVRQRTATLLVGKLLSAGPTDPETARRSMAAARQRAEEIVVRHGGAFVGALGGELVWVFGVPLVREDDVVRALRAADELRTELTGEAGPSTLTVLGRVSPPERSSPSQPATCSANCDLAQAGDDAFGSDASSYTSRSSTSRLSGGEERSSRSARATSRRRGSARGGFCSAAPGGSNRPPQTAACGTPATAPARWPAIAHILFQNHQHLPEGSRQHVEMPDRRIFARIRSCSAIHAAAQSPVRVPRR